METFCKSSLSGQEYLLTEYFFISPGWCVFLRIAASSLASFPVCPSWQRHRHCFCTVSSPTSGPFPREERMLLSWSSYLCKAMRSQILSGHLLFFKEQWCEPWHTWANSSWKILLKWTSFGSEYRKRYSSLSVLLKVGVILLLSSHLWLNFSGGMEIWWKWFNDRFMWKCPQIINKRISLGKKSY